MVRFRLSDPSKADIAAILRRSEREFGVEARKRYRFLLTTTFRSIASKPNDILVQNREALLPDLRSIHIRHFRAKEIALRVNDPVHIVFFRVKAGNVIEIVRVLHENSDFSRFSVDNNSDD